MKISLSWFEGLGLYIFPLRRGDLRPAIHKWPELAVKTAAEFRSGFRTENPAGESYEVRPSVLRHVVGVVTRSPLVVIDIDKHGAGDAPVVVESLVRERLGLPPTLKVRTKRGGYHLYYKFVSGGFCDYEEDIKRLSMSVLKGIHRQLDFKVGNSFVVGPGATGYEVVKDISIAELPPVARDYVWSCRSDRVRDADAPELALERSCKDVSKCERYVSAVCKNGFVRLRHALDGEINNRLFKEAATMGSYLHYCFYTEEQICSSLFKVLEGKAFSEYWTDWDTYWRAVEATIQSGIRAGLAAPAFVKDKGHK